MATSTSYPLRLPKSIKAAAEKLSKADGTSLNQFVATVVAEKIAVRATAASSKGAPAVRGRGLRGASPVSCWQSCRAPVASLRAKASCPKATSRWLPAPRLHAKARRPSLHPRSVVLRKGRPESAAPPARRQDPHRKAPHGDEEERRTHR